MYRSPSPVGIFKGDIKFVILSDTTKPYMKKILFPLIISVLMVSNIQAQNPLDLEFHRLAARRFIFSNNIPLSEFVPSEIVSFESMHPAFAICTSGAQCDTTFSPTISEGRLVLTHDSANGEASFYVGAVNPYATYDIDIQSLEADRKGSLETGFELSRLSLMDRVQLFARISGKDRGIYVRVFEGGNIERENILSDYVPDGPFTLRAQLYGNSAGFFVEENGMTTYIGHIKVEDHFTSSLDFRKVDVAANSVFNVYSNLQGKSVISGASSYLSSGVGQADIRVITYEDLTPYIDEGRLWFTFSCRGLGINQSCQGVLSLDPSVFDPRLEGVIVFDHGDGLLRNDYSSHLFYDRNAGEWHAYACDFGGTAYTDGRSGTGLLTAVSSKDPRKGYSVMKASRIGTDKIKGHHEDPCIFFDAGAGRWRLLSSVFTDNNIICGTFESDTWDGPMTPVVEPVEMNATGTSIQKVGDTYYCFMGGHGNLRVHSYPDLKTLGELDLDLQPHWPKPAGRVWASIVPLPEGYPYSYFLLTMDRPNFPDVKGPNWSYGALYFFGASYK